jgi:hypothetical protein
VTTTDEQVLNLYLPQLTSDELGLLENGSNTMHFINIVRQKFNLDLKMAKGLADRLRDYFGIARNAL